MSGIEDIEFEVKKKILLKAKEQLRCQECLNPKNPIDGNFFKCESKTCGKLFCQDCAEHLQKKCPFATTTQWYKSAGHTGSSLNKTDDCLCQSLWTEFPSFCKYEKFGCQELFRSEEIRNHEESCPYLIFDTGNEKIICPIQTCAFDLTGQDIKKHFQQTHWNVPFYQYSNSVFDSLRLNVQMARIYAHDKMFLFCSGGTDKITGIDFHACVFLLGHCQDAKNYRYKLKVCGARGALFAYTGKVHPLSESFEDILRDEKALVIQNQDLGKIIRNRCRPDIILDIELA